MAKIVIAFVLALVAIEGIQSALINRHPIVKALKINVLKPFGTRDGPILIPDYQLRKLVADTKTKIAQHIFDNDVFLAKKCGQAADTDVRTMEENATNGVYKGLDIMYDAFKPFEADYQKMMALGVDLEAKFEAIYALCQKEFPEDIEAYDKCVKDHAEADGLIPQLIEFQKLQDELYQAWTVPMNAAWRKFMEQSDELGEDITQQGVSVLANLSKCYA